MNSLTAISWLGRVYKILAQQLFIFSISLRELESQSPLFIQMWNDHKQNGNMKTYLFNGRLNEQPLQKSMLVLYHDQEVDRFLPENR